MVYLAAKQIKTRSAMRMRSIISQVGVVSMDADRAELMVRSIVQPRRIVPHQHSTFHILHDAVHTECNSQPGLERRVR